MENISFILPIQKESDLSEDKALKTINSIIEIYGSKNSELIIPYANSVKSTVKEFIDNSTLGHFKDVTYVECEKDDFCSMADKAIVSACSTKYFSIVSVEDEYTQNFLANFEKYSDDNKCSIYLYIGQIKNNEKPFVGFENEIAWAMGYATESGYVDKGSLEGYADFNMLCSVVNTNDYISAGRLNPEYGLVSWYEFLLRNASLDRLIFVIPKVGFIHNSDNMEEWAERFTKDKDYAKNVSSLIDKALSENNKEG